MFEGCLTDDGRLRSSHGDFTSDWKRSKKQTSNWIWMTVYRHKALVIEPIRRRLIAQRMFA
jgi:hypothetical protein